MDEQEWLRRIDEHLETSKHYMREGNELMARIDARLDRVERAFERNGIAFEDLREYLAQATTLLGALVKEVQAGTRESREWRRESRQWRVGLEQRIDRLADGPSPA